MLTAAGGEAAEIASLVEIGTGKKRITSRTVVDSLEVYASGPVRAAVTSRDSGYTRDGMEGPWSQRIELFAGSSYIKVEDTFIYAHFPGSHAKSKNPLSLWKLEARAQGDAKTSMWIAHGGGGGRGSLSRRPRSPSGQARSPSTSRGIRTRSSSARIRRVSRLAWGNPARRSLASPRRAACRRRSASSGRTRRRRSTRQAAPSATSRRR